MFGVIVGFLFPLTTAGTFVCLFVCVCVCFSHLCRHGGCAIKGRLTLLVVGESIAVSLIVAD